MCSWLGCSLGGCCGDALCSWGRSGLCCSSYHCLYFLGIAPSTGDWGYHAPYISCLPCSGFIDALCGDGEIGPVAGPPGLSLQPRWELRDPPCPGCFLGVAKIKGWVFAGGRQISSPSFHPAICPGNVPQHQALLLPHPPPLPGNPGVAAEFHCPGL